MTGTFLERESDRLAVETAISADEGLGRIEQPPLLDDDLYDDVRAVPEAESRAMARRLAAEEGLFGGTGTGVNVAAAVELAAERDPDDVIVTVACDTGLKYLDDDLFVE